MASVEVREELVELVELRAAQLRNHSTWSKSVAVCAHRRHSEALNGHVVGLNGHSTATQRPLNGHSTAMSWDSRWLAIAPTCGRTSTLRTSLR